MFPPIALILLVLALGIFGFEAAAQNGCSPQAVAQALKEFQASKAQAKLAGNTTAESLVLRSAGNPSRSADNLSSAEIRRQVEDRFGYLPKISEGPGGPPNTRMLTIEDKAGETLGNFTYEIKGRKMLDTDIWISKEHSNKRLSQFLLSEAIKRNPQVRRVETGLWMDNNNRVKKLKADNPGMTCMEAVALSWAGKNYAKFGFHVVSADCSGTNYLPVVFER